MSTVREGYDLTDNAVSTSDREADVASDVRAQHVKSDHRSTLSLPGADMAEVATGRRFVRSQIDGRVPDRTSDVMQLAASELVSNALLHGPRGPILVTVQVGSDEALLRVASERDDGAELPPIDAWTMAGPTAASGRGLGIVRAVSTRVEMKRSPRQVAITSYFEI